MVRGGSTIGVGAWEGVDFRQDVIGFLSVQHNDMSLPVKPLHSLLSNLTLSYGAPVLIIAYSTAPTASSRSRLGQALHRRQLFLATDDPIRFDSVHDTPISYNPRLPSKQTLSCSPHPQRPSRIFCRPRRRHPVAPTVVGGLAGACRHS